MRTINQFLFFDAKEKRFVKKTFVTVWQINENSAKPIMTFETEGDGDGVEEG